MSNSFIALQQTITVSYKTYTQFYFLFHSLFVPFCKQSDFQKNGWSQSLDLDGKMDLVEEKLHSCCEWGCTEHKAFQTVNSVDLGVNGFFVNEKI